MNPRYVESASLSIGKVALRAGIGVETIRFYEHEGLLAAPARRDSGYRLYTEGVIGRIRSIRRAKELGFSLKEIKELLQLRRNSSRKTALIEALFSHIQLDGDADPRLRRDSRRIERRLAIRENGRCVLGFTELEKHQAALK
jgi:DNA-binding transcriptional MerR regulator